MEVVISSDKIVETRKRVLSEGEDNRDITPSSPKKPRNMPRHIDISDSESEYGETMIPDKPIPFGSVIDILIDIESKIGALARAKKVTPKVATEILTGLSQVKTHVLRNDEAKNIRSEWQEFRDSFEGMMNEVRVKVSSANMSLTSKTSAELTSQNDDAPPAIMALVNQSDVPTTYAEVLSSAEPIVPLKVVTKRKPKKVRAAKRSNRLVIVHPSEGNDQNSKSVKDLLKKAINLGEKSVQVKRVVNDRNGVKIVVGGSTDLTVFTQNQDLKDAGLQVSIPEKDNPRMIIFDVCREYSEAEVEEGLRKQNQISDTDKISLKFKTGPKDGETVHWVVEVSPSLRTKWKKKGSVFVLWKQCKIRDFIVPTQCYKCQKFGHVARGCKSKTTVCGHCAGNGHSKKDCSKISLPGVCSNCISNEKTGTHKVYSRFCPVYKLACRRERTKSYD